MLENLSINNVILIDELKLSFHQGFTVFTGETGSGKSALVQSLRLILGEKFEISTLRKGSDKGSITATFSGSYPKLKEMGIEADELLIIKRELYSSGKTKAYINQQPVTISTLKKIGDDLLEIADQKASLLLLNQENHQRLFDLFASINLEIASKKHQTFLEKKRDLAHLEQEFIERTREKKALQKDLDALEGIENEETILQEYSQLIHAQERIEIAEQFLNDCPSLFSFKLLLEKLASFDPSLQPLIKNFHSSLLEIDEVKHSLRNYSSKITLSENRLVDVERHLSNIDKLSKRYGSLTLARERFTLLNKNENEKESLELDLEILENDVDQLFTKITTERKKACPIFEALINEQLHSLNMEHADFKVKITKKPRSLLGDESISFWMTPNRGENLIEVKDQISGGEMSRLLLAIKTLIASKEKKPMVLFDEIDSNIGGTTALTIGQKFLEISKNRQVIVITHFPQVAKTADHHFKIDKIDKIERTFTNVERLTAESIQSELNRMHGIHQL
ncbi:AAA family ATPase [Chlamydiales bacterium]|nr:AAA family ATPase [Chlamydiales bacterium]